MLQNKRWRARLGLAALAVAAIYSGGGGAGAADRPPAQIYGSTCAQCHEGGVPRAPHAVEFQMMGPGAILTALESGVMQEQGAQLTPGERRSLAEYLGGAGLAEAGRTRLPSCTKEYAHFDVNRPSLLAGWGMTLENSRTVSAADAQLAARDVPRLKLKWAFAFPGATRARSQPTVGAGAVFVGSQDGTVYALDYH